MPTPLAAYWRTVGASAWRNAATDPPPAPPTEVEWLERPAGMTEQHYLNRVSLGALATFTGPQKP